MEHSEPEPLADDGQRSATPDDQPLGGPIGPGDEDMPSQPLKSEGDEGPREPHPEDEQSS